MARQSIDLPLAEQTGAYWQACKVLRHGGDLWQLSRARRVIVVLAQCESTYGLRTAARKVMASSGAGAARSL